MAHSEALQVQVAVVGGGPAGLSAAITLSRFRRAVVVIDAGRPRNAAAGGVHNVLGVDGTAPEQLLARGRAELERYGGQVIADTAVGAARAAGGFEVALACGATVSARRLIVAAGVRDVLPEVSGLAPRWGHDVLHCPYCHGFEVAGQRIGVLATGSAAAHQAQLFAELSDDVVVFTHTAPALDAAQVEALGALGVEMVDGAVEEVLVDVGRLTGVRLAGGRVVERDVLVVAPQVVADCAVLDDLGVERDPANPCGYAAGPGGATAQPGVWVAGNVADPFGAVAAAAAQGVTVGAAVNTDLITERARRAVQTRRGAPFTAANEARICELVAGDRRHGLDPVTR